MDFSDGLPTEDIDDGIPMANGQKPTPMAYQMDGLSTNIITNRMNRHKFVPKMGEEEGFHRSTVS